MKGYRRELYDEAGRYMGYAMSDDPVFPDAPSFWFSPIETAKAAKDKIVSTYQEREAEAKKKELDIQVDQRIGWDVRQKYLGDLEELKVLGFIDPDVAEKRGTVISNAKTQHEIDCVFTDLREGLKEIREREHVTKSVTRKKDKIVSTEKRNVALGGAGILLSTGLILGMSFTFGGESMWTGAAVFMGVIVAFLSLCVMGRAWHG